MLGIRSSRTRSQRCIFESELLDRLLVAGIAERSGHNTATRHDRMDLPKGVERNGTECAIKRILRVNHIGATIYGAASLGGIRNADQKLHVETTRPMPWPPER